MLDTYSVFFGMFYVGALWAFTEMSRQFHTFATKVSKDE